MRQFIEQWLGLNLLQHKIDRLECIIQDQEREIDKLRKELEIVNMELRVWQTRTKG